MKREIEFRGKCLNTGELIYSYDILRREDWIDNKWIIRYFMQNGHSCNQTPKTENFIEVDPATVGEYTGLPDKHGVKIFEGDVIRALQHNANYPLDYVVVFNEDAAFAMRWMDRYNRGESCYYDQKIAPSKYKTFEIIGNIHSNPELLK